MNFKNIIIIKIELLMSIYYKLIINFIGYNLL